MPAGTRFAGYRINGVIGRGGMSIVYEAEHLQLGRRLALKVLARGLARDDSFRDRFIRESQIAASLDHPNIVQIYDAGESDGFLYIAMRHVDGADVRTLLERQGQLGLGQTLYIVEQVARALDAAHERGLVHRDIKPGNILVAQPSERVFLTDFGIAKQAAAAALTKTGYFLGTYDYAAPEQLEGRAIDGRTDLYALGCVLYECLSGEAPFQAQTEGSIIRAHLVEPPPKLTAKRPDLPRGLNGVIETAMAKAKENRYSSCGELASAFRAATRDDEVHGATGFAYPAAGTMPPAAETILAPPGAPSPEPAPPRAAAPPRPAPERAASEEPAEAPPPRAPRTITVTTPRLLAVAAALAALLAAAIVAAVLLSGDENSDSTGAGATATTAPGTPTATATEASQPQPQTAPAGLASLVPRTIFKDCRIDPAPSPGAVESASCGPPTERTLPFYPDGWQVSIYPTAARMNAAYNALRQRQDIGRDFGRCNGVTWGGELQWFHGPNKPGGRAFCYFDGNVAVIVWTHGKLGQATHIDTLGIARAGGSDHAGLFNWYRFWHHQIGKCPQTGCIARVQ